MKMNDLSATCCDSKLGRVSNMLPAIVLAAILSLPMAASGLPLFSSLFVFGDSLADAGNNAIVLDTLYGPGAARSSTPIPAADFIPDYPYTSNRYSNGPVWTEQFASSLGLSAQPSLMGGTNFAFGGARMGPLFSSFPYSVSDQLASFLSAKGGVAPASALYVVQGGGNDVRDIFAGGGDPSALVSAYVASTIGILSELKSAGAYNILFANIPDIGKAPAIQALGPDAVFGASMLVTEMNNAVDTALMGLPASFMSGIHELDLFSLIDQIFNDPAAFGMVDVTSSCAYTCIADPAATFFWDGIHPTTAGHMIIASAALAAIPEPATLVLIFIGFAGLGLIRQRQYARCDSAPNLRPGL